MRILLALALASACTGCATVTRGTTDQVQILSNPDGADARTSMGHSCVTPCTLQFSRKDEFSVTISKPGFQPQTVPVKTQIAGAGAAGFAGNVLIGGIVGMSVDAATGATYEHVPNPVSVDLVPLRASPPPVHTHVSPKPAPKPHPPEPKGPES
jgi:hypothetical protein